MTVELFCSFVSTILTSTLSTEVNLILHGGEPTLLPSSWFRKAVPYVNDVARRHDKTLRVMLQSNLVTIPDEKLQTFADLHIGLGVSLDSPSTLSASFRPFAEKVVANFWRARAFGIEPGVLSTINASNWDKFDQICDWLHREMRVPKFKANVAYPVGAGITMPVPSADEILNAQLAILRYMLATDADGVVEDNLGREILRFLQVEVNRRPRDRTLCDEQRCGAGVEVVGVTPDGSILPCGRFAWDDANYFLGTASGSGTSNLLDHLDRTNRFHQLHGFNWTSCAQCEAKSVCGFGCQAFIARSNARQNLECLPTQNRFLFYKEHREQLIRVGPKIDKRLSPRRDGKASSSLIADQKLTASHAVAALAELRSILRDAGSERIARRLITAALEDEIRQVEEHFKENQREQT